MTGDQPSTDETMPTDEEPGPRTMGETDSKPRATAPKPDIGQGHDSPSDLAAQNAEVAKATNEIAGGT